MWRFSPQTSVGVNEGSSVIYSKGRRDYNGAHRFVLKTDQRLVSGVEGLLDSDLLLGVFNKETGFKITNTQQEWRGVFSVCPESKDKSNIIETELKKKRREGYSVDLKHTLLKSHSFDLVK